MRLPAIQLSPRQNSSVSAVSRVCRFRRCCLWGVVSSLLAYESPPLKEASSLNNHANQRTAYVLSLRAAVIP